MTMEHRWSKRQPLVLDVVLKCSGKPDLIVRARDIAHDGMFVCVKRGSLRKGDILDVEFSLEDELGSKHYCQKAWVVHSSDEGAGLMFITACSPAIQKKGGELYE